MSDEPLDLDKHWGMAAQKVTDIRRALAEVENNARDLREGRACSKRTFYRFRQLPEWRRSRRRATCRIYTQPGSVQPTPIIATWSQPYLRTLPGSPAMAEQKS
jgi:hypothetical protein